MEIASGQDFCSGVYVLKQITFSIVIMFTGYPEQHIPSIENVKDIVLGMVGSDLNHLREI
jgi:hypothetical protein